MFRDPLQAGLTKLNSMNRDCLWVKLDKHFFGLDTDIYMCNAYIVPRDSPYFTHQDTDVMSILRQEINKYALMGDILLIGDLNSRIGLFQEPNNDTEEIVRDTDYASMSSDQARIAPFRDNQDRCTNANGQELISILNACNLLTVNGRTVGDLSGKFTYHGPNGSSAIDMVIISPELREIVRYFWVADPVPFSDHCPIYLNLSTGHIVHKEQEDQGTNPLHKFVWQSGCDQELCKILRSESYQTKLSKFCQSEQSDSTRACDELTSILHNATRAVCAIKTTQRRKCKLRNNGTEHNPQIQQAKQNFKKAKRDFQNSGFAVNRRAFFLAAKRKYKNTVNRVQNYIKERKLNKLASIEKSDPKTFWKSIKDIISTKRGSTSSINSGEWVAYFDKLLNGKCANYDEDFENYVKCSLPTIENASDQNGPLDFPIEAAEIRESIKKLKKGKAAGKDMIINEILKAGQESLITPLCHLFNLILTSGQYPKTWTSSIIVPIPKSGDLSKRDNYRGIAVSSCLGKTLSILNQRLEKYMVGNNKWTRNQCGFMKDHRTEDNIFTLKSIQASYVVKKGKPVYLAFVDFKNFFDTIGTSCSTNYKNWGSRANSTNY